MPKATDTLQRLRRGDFDAPLSHLYGRAALDTQKERYTAALDAFMDLFGKERDIAIYSTPGRCEVGGNHTDHQNGLVLAAAVSLDTIAIVAKNGENTIRVASQGFADKDEVKLDDLVPVPAEQGRSAALLRGVASGIAGQGGRIGGFDAYTTSGVLVGSGLSSSAAFEVCMAEVLNGEYNEGAYHPITLAQISQRAENLFFGKPSGLMDQTACAVGGVIMIDFEDPKKPVVTPLNLDLAAHGHRLVVTNTGGSHADLTDDYAAVRKEMTWVAKAFGKETLRQVKDVDFQTAIPKLRTAGVDRPILRAMHFYDECRRVGQMRQSIEEDDFTRFLQLVNEAGHSAFELNENAFSTRYPKQQGIPLALGLSRRALRGTGACRLQGGGFAGTVQAFVPEEKLPLYVGTLEAVFGKGACQSLSFQPQGCVQVLGHEV